MQINIPEVVEELKTVFASYETALMQNDVDALITFFWNSPLAIRFGVNETLYGWQEIVQFRQQRLPPPSRTLFNTVITTFGRDYANANTEFTRADGQGRQSQSWIRTAEGWKIVAAHISFVNK